MNYIARAKQGHILLVTIIIRVSLNGNLSAYRIYLIVMLDPLSTLWPNL